jgi:hypothetical protein
LTSRNANERPTVKIGAHVSSLMRRTSPPMRRALAVVGLAVLAGLAALVALSDDPKTYERESSFAIRPVKRFRQTNCRTSSGRSRSRTTRSRRPSSTSSAAPGCASPPPMPRASSGVRRRAGGVLLDCFASTRQRDRRPQLTGPASQSSSACKLRPLERPPASSAKTSACTDSSPECPHLARADWAEVRKPSPWRSFSVGSSGLPSPRRAVAAFVSR